MAKKSTRAETAKRVNDVYDKLLSGWTNPAIVKYGKKTWGLSESGVRKYIKTAIESVAKFADGYREFALQINIAKRAELYRMALEDNDKRLALEVARDESKLLGLYAPERSQVQSQNIDIDLNGLDDDQLKRLASGEDIVDILAGD
jgi:hypothetical protein